MKKLILISTIVFLFSGCIDLTDDEAFFERPSLRLDFQDQTKNTIVDAKNFTSISFNDYFYENKQHNLTLNNDLSEILILHGVPEDTYGVFVFTEQYNAILDTVKYTITQPKLSKSHDPIRVGDGEYYIRRANATQVITLKDLYIRFLVEIKGALDLSAQNDFVLTLKNLPQEFDFYGDHSHEKLSDISPELEYFRNEDVITADFHSNKFCPNEDVRLILTVKNKEVFNFNISDYIEEASIDMALDNLIIPIKVDVSSAGTGITVNGWDHVLSYKNEIGV